MEHLTIEDLARLVEDEPTADESRHLHDCGECREELEGLRAQTATLRSLPDLAAPDSVWRGVEARMRREGIPASAAVTRGRFGGWAAYQGGPLLRMAATIALFVAGGVTGALLQGPGGVGQAADVAAITTADDAAQAVQTTEAAYLEALTRYAELSGSSDTIDPLSRLVALESIVLTTRAALEESPADPVINGYHLTALSQREAVLRQISNPTGDGWY
jgi:hypothetical protein